MKGPRQVGKTKAVLEFASKNYEHIIYINFVQEDKYKKIIADGYSAEDIVKNISRINPMFHFKMGMYYIINTVGPSYRTKDVLDSLDG